MAEQAAPEKALSEDWRDMIMSDPDMVLEDRDVMRALIAANEAQMGGNIVDMRGIAMERLETRLDRLEDTHRSVIAAAYENLAGTNMIHRAILRMMDHAEFEPFLQCLATDVAEILRVDRVRLVLESKEAEGADLGSLSDVMTAVPPGFIQDYLTGGRDVPARQVTLRQVVPNSTDVFGADADWIRSEALLKLDLGAGRLPGMLSLGAEDPHQFRATQGTDLLTFFTGIFERAMRRYLA